MSVRGGLPALGLVLLICNAASADDDPLAPDLVLAAQRHVAEQAGVPFVDVRKAMLAATGGGDRWGEFHLAADNCHPNDAGHAVWARAAAATTVAAIAPRPPNVVLIVADDLGYADVGCFGAADIRTPHIDRLAAEGTRFTSFCVAQAVCTASRAALLTGCYPNRIGMTGALNHESPQGVHPQERLLSELLHDRGYATAAFGKWHLGIHPPFWPTRRGYDEFFGIPYSNDNGPFLAYGNHAGAAVPFREGKLTAFEGGVRVPAGRTCDELVTALDLFATIVAFTGAEPPRLKTDGCDLRDLLRGAAGATGRDTFWCYSGDELHAVRQGRWKLHLAHDYLTIAGPPGRDGKPAKHGQMQPLGMSESGVRGIASRHGYDVATQPPALYDLRDDPGETTDVAADHPDVVARLEAVAAQARAELGDTLTGARGAGVRPGGDIRHLPDEPGQRRESDP